MKNIEEKSKNKCKKIGPKIINNFLVCKFINKPRKIVNYHQSLTLSGYSTKKLNGSNLVYLNYIPSYRIQYRLKINTNLS